MTNSAPGTVPGVIPSIPAIPLLNNASSSSSTSVPPSIPSIPHTTNNYTDTSSNSTHHHKSQHTSSHSDSRDRHHHNFSKHRSRSRSRSPRDKRGNSSSYRRSSRSRSPSDRNRRRRNSRSRSRERAQPVVSVQAALAAATGNISNVASNVSSVPHLNQMNEYEKNKLVAAALAKVGALVGNIGGSIPGIPQPNVPGNSSSSTSNGVNEANRPYHRLYVGNIPTGCTNADIQKFFNETISKVYQQGNHVSNVYLHQEKRYAFVEFFSTELCTACLTGLDGIVWRGNTLRMRRPSDYNAATAPPPSGPPITLRTANVDVISSVVVDGPNKLFIGGLNRNLKEDQLRQLLQSLGPLKSFQLMKDTADLNKGYAFAEYQDPALTDKAILALNNVTVIDKPITVKRALDNNKTAPIGGTNSNLVPIGNMQPSTIPNYGIPQTMGYPSTTATSMIPQTNPAMSSYPGYPNMLLNMYGQPGMVTAPAQMSSLNMYGYGTTTTTSTIPSYLTPGMIPQPQIPSQPPSVPSMRVIRLTNLSTMDDLATDQAYQDLILDVTEELSNYGKLDHAIIIPRTGTQAGAVYARYSQPSEALQAQTALSTRTFAGRTLGITFESEAAFAAMALGYGTT